MEPKLDLKGYYLIITSQEVGCCDRTYDDTRLVWANDINDALSKVKAFEIVEAAYFCGKESPIEVEVI